MAKFVKLGHPRANIGTLPASPKKLPKKYYVDYQQLTTF
jgi:hypothetical protein